MARHKEKSAQELKSFGCIMCLVLTAIGGLMLWKGSRPAPYVLLLAAAFGFSGLLAPTLLRKPEKVWMAFGEKMSVVVTTLIMMIAFFCVITPMGLLLRLLRKDLLSLRLEPDKESYWLPTEKDGPNTRPFLPY